MNWDARPAGPLRLSPLLKWTVLGAGGFFMAAGVLAVVLIATDAGPRSDRERRHWPALEAGTASVTRPTPLPDDGCDGHETLCATAATDDPGATLQRLGAAWRPGEAQRYRVRVVVAPDAP